MLFPSYICLEFIDGYKFPPPGSTNDVREGNSYSPLVFLENVEFIIFFRKLGNSGIPEQPIVAGSRSAFISRDSGIILHVYANYGVRLRPPRGQTLHTGRALRAADPIE